jgi:hypothetical protein
VAGRSRDWAAVLRQGPGLGRNEQRGDPVAAGGEGHRHRQGENPRQGDVTNRAALDARLVGPHCAGDPAREHMRRASGTGTRQHADRQKSHV